MKEIETRIIDINLEEVRTNLLNLGIKKVKAENQINKIFDFNDRRLLQNKGYARIRIVEDILHNSTHYYMTTKKLLSQEKYKIMEENETEIINGDAGENIFLSLGLSLVQSIKKYRESYQYKSTLIEIDINEKEFCPFPYIEFETDNEEELLEIIEKLGFSIEDTTSKTIFEILKDYNIEHKY